MAGPRSKRRSMYEVETRRKMMMKTMKKMMTDPVRQSSRMPQ